jgi:hypothetical protein
MSVSTATRKTNTQRDRQTVEKVERIVGNMTPQLRSRIIEAARRHRNSAAGDPRELSRVVSKNLGISEAIVDEVIFTQMEAVESELAMLRTGIFSAVEMAKGAGRAVWQDKRGVA